MKYRFFQEVIKVNAFAIGNRTKNRQSRFGIAFSRILAVCNHENTPILSWLALQFLEGILGLFGPESNRGSYDNQHGPDDPKRNMQFYRALLLREKILW